MTGHSLGSGISAPRSVARGGYETASTWRAGARSKRLGPWRGNRAAASGNPVGAEFSLVKTSSIGSACQAGDPRGVLEGKEVQQTAAVRVEPGAGCLVQAEA